MPENAVHSNSETPTGKTDSYDPIKMLRDFLKDNPAAPGYLSNYLVNRLGDQIVWYDKKSGFFKRKWEGFRKTVIILSASIPFLVGLIGLTFDGKPNDYFDFIIKLVVGMAGVAIAILEGLNSLYKSQEHYVDYRVTAEQLRQEFCYFLGKSGEYAGLSDELVYAKLISRAESIIASESNHWAEVTRQNEKAIKADDIQTAVQDFFKKNGVEFSPKVKKTPEAEPDPEAKEPNPVDSEPDPEAKEPNPVDSEPDPEDKEPNPVDKENN